MASRLHRPRSEYRAEVTVDLAPDNLNQAGELYPKAICYLIFKDHPILLRDASAGTVNDQTSRHFPHNENSPPSTDDVKDSTLRNRMTAKSYFKSQNTLRASKSDRKKKKVSGGKSDNVIDLTIDTCHEAVAAKKHAEAAMIQAVASLHQAQLAALQKAQDMGISTDELRPFIMKTLNNVYSCGRSVLKLFAIDTDSSCDDPNIIVLETPPIADRKRPAIGSGHMLCAAGDHVCVYIPRKVTDSDPVCPMCKKIAHAICIMVDNEKEGCMACYVDEEL
jgi:hypothetical protein